MEDVDRTIEGPVAFVVTRDVKPGAIEQYEEWLSKVGASAHELDPSLTMTVIKPGDKKNAQYVVVLNFSSHEKLDEWESSDVRKQLRREVKSLEAGKASFSEVTGFEYWFCLPKIAATRPPARYKMILITIIGLFALSLTYTYSVEHFLEPLPDHVETLIRILVLVVIMTYIFMPLLRVFSPGGSTPGRRGTRRSNRTEGRSIPLPARHRLILEILRMTIVKPWISNSTVGSASLLTAGEAH